MSNVRDMYFDKKIGEVLDSTIWFTSVETARLECGKIAALVKTGVLVVDGNKKKYNVPWNRVKV